MKNETEKKKSKRGKGEHTTQLLVELVDLLVDFAWSAGLACSAGMAYLDSWLMYLSQPKSLRLFSHLQVQEALVSISLMLT